MGFSYDTSRQFVNSFLRNYLETDEEEVLKSIIDKAAFVGSVRMIHRMYKRGKPSENAQKTLKQYLSRVAEFTEKLDSLSFL
jgi:IS4 transposase